VLAQRGITVLVSTHYMDEAERCHRLAYISQGKLIAHGTAGALIEKSNLKAWRVTGENLFAAAEHLSRLKGVETVAAFGSGLHVSGSDEAAMSASLKPFLKAHRLASERVSPTLEDVFIHFMKDGREGGDAR
ncbi:MAG TPA: ABC transporter ATP-binding protein, partial [Sphingomonadales bacterium]|nr:ABC transporter ATP-binding protein [Sphingomonadales bacterium]